jgi:hypothetical protein
MFAVDDIDDTLARLRKHGAELESLEVVQYQDAYRLCYIRAYLIKTEGTYFCSRPLRKKEADQCSGSAHQKALEEGVMS